MPITSTETVSLSEIIISIFLSSCMPSTSCWTVWSEDSIMKNVAIYVSGPYGQDQLFNPDSYLNRDDCLLPFRDFQRRVAASGGRCHTLDVFESKAGALPEVVLFLDIPEKHADAVLGPRYASAQKWVVLQECEVVLPRNWDLNRHLEFDKIFTWNDDYLKEDTYRKLNFSQKLEPRINWGERSGFCTMIAGNKSSSRPNELYSERKKAIRWFEQNAPQDFDLYGMGWDSYRFEGPKAIRALNKIKPLTRMLAEKYPSYVGKVDQKNEVLNRYRFAICYENAEHIHGYITEKIFDCLLAGCIPVYWGAPNISEIVPKDCFIDRRDFSRMEDLYAYMKGISEEERMGYLRRIQAYFDNNGPYMYSAEFYVDTLFKELEHEA
ncbi:hypothetical protein B9G55_10400 [Saccharibacillus sp. O16]|nr:hypothetical protein B9G55_10400 [Saccharibacillus sp. O16]